MMMANPPLMQVRNLTTRFHTAAGTVFAVNGISYHLHQGETLGIVGESGCGKSVHALSVMRLLPTPPAEVVEGSVTLQGRDLLALPESEMRHVRGGEIAMIFQDPLTSLNPVLTIGRQIGEALQLHKGMGRRQARGRAAELLDLVGIPAATRRLNAYPHELSGGQRQRAVIAMALAGEPRILIADEPTTALDVTVQAQILDLVRKLREQTGLSMVWITHDLGVMAGLARRVMVMYAGFIVEKAPVQELYAAPRHPYTLGLLNSLPRLDKRRAGERLVPIAGAPPDRVGPPTGCPFAPRCAYAVDRCIDQNPPLEEVAPGHEVACWVDVREGAG